MSKITTITELVDAIDQLETKLSSFNMIWPDYAHFIELYAVPFIHKDNGRIRAIEFETIKGQPAIELAKQKIALLRWEHDDQKRRSSSRLPGVIYVTEDLSKLVFTINELKSRIQQGFTDLIPRTNRRTFMRSHYPEMNLIHLYRKLYCIDHEPRRIGFTWAGHMFRSEKIKPEKALDMLEKSRLDAPVKYDDSTWNDIIDKQIERIHVVMQQKHMEIRHRREIEPHPLVNIYDYQDKEQPVLPPKPINGHLPIFVVAPIKNNIRLEGLKHWVYASNRKRRIDTLKDEAFIHKLHLSFVDIRTLTRHGKN